MSKRLAVALLLSVLAGGSQATTPAQDYVGLHLTSPEADVLWLTPALRQRAEAILGHPFAALRVRYWRQDGQTVWILDEIGKEQPITAGILVRAGRIADVKVLAYRESRGGEVQQSFFLRQFKDATLASPQDRLNRRVDGITGATLSVRAMQNMARLALLFDSQRQGNPVP